MKKRDGDIKTMVLSLMFIFYVICFIAIYCAVSNGRAP